MFANSDLEKKLAERYGSEAQDILLKYGFSEDLWRIEAYQAIHTTMCLNLIDFYTRRVPLVLSEKNHGLEFLDTISEVFKSELGLSLSEIEKQKMDLIHYIDIELGWRTSFN
jgi:glycerol-3-phosphate dehydrogenase